MVPSYEQNDLQVQIGIYCRCETKLLSLVKSRNRRQLLGSYFYPNAPNKLTSCLRYTKVPSSRKFQPFNLDDRSSDRDFAIFKSRTRRHFNRLKYERNSVKLKNTWNILVLEILGSLSISNIVFRLYILGLKGRNQLRYIFIKFYVIPIWCFILFLVYFL